MEKSQDLLHGVTLEMILNYLVEHCGWEEMGERIPVRCFHLNPSIKSSLKFLRRTPWAREKVQALYLKKIKAAARKNSEKSSF